MRSFHLPGRSPVLARRAMCATSHPLASLAAIEILKAGGNAVDAAIATAAVLAVVEPAMTGIGGDCFAMIARPGAAPIALNASGRAPAAATIERYAGLGLAAIPMQSPHAVTVPGAVDGWARLLSDHGTMTFAQVLAPAIDHAEHGFPVAPRVGQDWARALTKLMAHEGARRHLLKDGRAPRVGEVMRFPALAATLRRIAAEGRAGFYEGPVAADIVATLRAQGGLHTAEDLARQRASYVTPLSIAYRGVELHELPPNNQGIVALMLLGLLERVGKPGEDPLGIERYHVMMEAARLAFRARDTFVADPEMADVPVVHMLSRPFLDDLAGRIDRKARRADIGPMPRPAGTDTVCFSIVDASGLAVSFINSLFSDFGSGIVGLESGVTLHNRGQGFVLDPSHPNGLAPGKRPLHTLVPAIATKDGAPWMAFGVMGAHFQPMGHVYVLTNRLDYGMDAQEALDHPRIFLEGDRLDAEDGVPETVVEGLAALGHTVGRRAVPWGGGQIVEIDRANGVLIGASDPRKDGLALGY